ncbi:hypothetical protein ACH4LQ_28020 [Streptomyces globisporus]|uniref:hypothetical protein n=1 Tax=Streptomyces globisporus TaxID=1908 RepID=UPI0037AFABFB
MWWRGRVQTLRTPRIFWAAQVSLAAYGLPAELPPGDCAGRMPTLRRAGVKALL